MSDHEITADWMTLLDQSVSTATMYFRAAVREIDEQFGEDYSREHPELVSGLMFLMAKDLESSSFGVGFQKISKAFERVSESIESIGFRL